MGAARTSRSQNTEADRGQDVKADTQALQPTPADAVGAAQDQSHAAVERTVKVKTTKPANGGSDRGDLPGGTTLLEAPGSSLGRDVERTSRDRQLEASPALNQKTLITPAPSSEHTSPEMLKTLRSRWDLLTRKTEAQTDKEGPTVRAWRAHLGQLRAEVQDLQSLLNKVRRGEASVAVYDPYIKRTVRDISTLLETVVETAQGIPSALDSSDIIRRLSNTWELMRISPLLQSPLPQIRPEEQVQHLNLLDAQCRTIVFHIGLLTIPSRLNSWLAQGTSGYYVPFHTVFEDEMPVQEDRVKLLNLLSWQPNIVRNGMVDADTGLIYRYSSQAWRRWLSVAAVVGTLMLLTLLISPPLIDEWPWSWLRSLSGWLPFPDANRDVFLGYWIAVLAGITVHVAVATAKRIRTQGSSPPVLAPGRAVAMIDAKLGHIVLKLTLAFIAYVGLVVALGAQEVDILNSFLLGYSLDSAVELFATSVEQQASARLTSFRKQLGVVS